MMKGSKVWLAAGITMLALLSSASAASAEPTPLPLPNFAMDAMTADGKPATSEFVVPAGTYKDAAGKVVTLRDPQVYTCNGKTDSPHWSSGSSSVIAKTRVTCTGPTNLTLGVGVYSLLGKTAQNNVASLVIVAESNYQQNVVSNGGAQTWYVPATGSGTHISRGAYFRGSHSGQIQVPAMGGIGAAASQFLYVP